jgi:hypothetical protein
MNDLKQVFDRVVKEVFGLEAIHVIWKQGETVYDASKDRLTEGLGFDLLKKMAGEAGDVAWSEWDSGLKVIYKSDRLGLGS